jgi:hypothetical protein
MRSHTVRWMAALTFAVVAACAVPSRLAAQLPAGTLTALDYAEIQQLYAQYAHGIDTHADEGWMYANTFTEDGVLTSGSRTWVGRGAIAELAKPPGDPSLVHAIVNVKIEPSQEGADVDANMMQLTLGEPGTPPTVKGFGRYVDVTVRTAEGWRFKKKTWTLLSAPAEP